MMSSGCVLIDEIEDGFNPELLQRLVDYLRSDSSAQVLMTTHSPLIINFMPDEMARKSVKFVYKNQQGETAAIDFFGLPGVGEKLGLLGPGEVMVDVNLEEKSKSAARLAKSEKTGDV
jgi:predicted ATP-binding protein involved in virulence